MIDINLVNDEYSIANPVNHYDLKINLRRGQKEVINSMNKQFGENFLFIAPTAYGKTITAIHYICKMVNNGFKVIYTAPLKALTAEVVEKLHKIGFKVLEDTGDFRKDPKKDYEKCEVLITTYERLDAVIRNPSNHGVFDDFGLLVIDEVHTIHSDSRGVNLESLIVKVKEHTSMAIYGMSATASNYKEIANFLHAKYVHVPVEERPIKQEIKIMYHPDGYTSKTVNYRMNQIIPVFQDLIRRDKQALIFCSSRNRCEQLAKNMSGINTRNAVEMAKKSNYTFHHAGVALYDKKEVENMFLQNKVKFIFCTPTLAMGVNLPAYCVVIFDTCRWSGLLSDNVRIENLEVEQMVGRAGRPQFGEKTCEVYILARDIDDPYEFEENIIKSKLCREMKGVFNEWVCSGMDQAEDIKNSLIESFLYQQMEESKIMEKCQESFTYLLTNGFIKQTDSGSFTSTFLGKMTALFYIRPETALHFKKIERKVVKRALDNDPMTDLELVANLLNTDEFLDNIRVDSKGDAKLIDVCDLAFRDNSIKDNKLYEERIMKAIPMIFVSHFEKQYNTKIVMYRTDVIELNQIMERLMSSAGVIIYDKSAKKRINDLFTMIKNKTLDKNVAIMRNTKGLGDVRMNRLYLEGIKTPEQFLNTSETKLMNIMKISKKVLDEIKLNLKEELRKEGIEVKEKEKTNNISNFIR